MRRGKVVSALPYETDDFHYLVRMTLAEAYDIIENDEDFGDDGILRDDFALQGFEGAMKRMMWKRSPTSRWKMTMTMTIIRKSRETGFFLITD